MQNQVLDNKSFASRDMPDRPNRNAVIFVIAVIAFLAIAAVVGTQSRTVSAPQAVAPVTAASPVSLPGSVPGLDHFPDMASTHMPSEVAAQYVQDLAAAEQALSIAPAISPPATYTQQYWDLAAAHAAATASDAEYATYTDRYWEAEAAWQTAQQAEAQAAPAYFTEQYWTQADEYAVRSASSAGASALEILEAAPIEAAPWYPELQWELANDESVTRYPSRRR